MDVTTQLALNNAESMRVFADGEPRFNFGQWKQWKQACMVEGRTIPPAEFKNGEKINAKSIDNGKKYPENASGA